MVNYFCRYTEECFFCVCVVQARIDSHNKILYARHADQRNTTFQRVLQTGSDFQRETRAMLLRANLMRQDFVMKGGRKQS
jgi:COP9 signalosome complex subunit 1